MEDYNKNKTTFSQEHFERAYPTGIENHYWTNARGRIVFHEIEKNCLSTYKILEIGCGRGVVLDCLRAKGIDCHGVVLRL